MMHAMRITYPGLRRNEKAFRNWSGLSVNEFDELYQRFEPAWVQAESARLQGRERQRSVGGGGDYTLDLDTRLLLVLVWLRHYPTGETLGDLFGVSQSTVSRTLTRTLSVLYQIAADNFHTPPPKVGRRTLPQLQQEEPDLFAIVDATEQSVNRPQDDEQARLHFSGKQRRPTGKNAIHCNEHGVIRQVSATQPGSIHDVTQLRQSGLLNAIPPDTITVADAAFVGIYKDLPNQAVLVPYKAYRGHPLQPEQRYANRLVAAIRIKVEHVFAQLKVFRILTHRFRHALATIHSQVFLIIAALYNWRTLNRLQQTELAA